MNNEQALGRAVSIKTYSGTRGIFTSSTTLYMQNVIYFQSEYICVCVYIYIYFLIFNLGRGLVIRTRAFAMRDVSESTTWNTSKMEKMASF